MSETIQQSEVNQICEALKSQDKKITISEVRALLGKGTHSQLVHAVLRYKEDAEKAKQYAQTETETAVSENQNEAKSVKKAPRKINLLTKLKAYIKSIELDFDEAYLIEIAKLSEQAFQTRLDNTEKKHRKELQQLKIQIDHLETRLYAANELLVKNKAIIEHLNQQQTLLSRTDTPRDDFKSKFSSSQSAAKTQTAKPAKGPSVEEQLFAINSARAAAYDFTTGNIVLKANDFNGPLLKILRLNQREVISANVSYEYKTRFYHLSNCTDHTISFLNDYHFAFSDALTKQIDKIFNH